MLNLIEVIVISLLGGICAAVLFYFIWQNIKNHCFSKSQEEWRKEWRLTHSNSLRGNLIKTFAEDIDNTYYLDAEKQLGKGGCGVVITGIHKDSGQEYAIKTVVKQSSERGRIDREIKLLKDVDHTNIVRLFEVYDTPTHVYFVMELCMGGHLGNTYCVSAWIHC